MRRRHSCRRVFVPSIVYTPDAPVALTWPALTALLLVGTLVFDSIGVARQSLPGDHRGAKLGVITNTQPAVVVARLRLIAGLYPSKSTINMPMKAHPVTARMSTIEVPQRLVAY
jgi:hypothetical protein